MVDVAQLSIPWNTCKSRHRYHRIRCGQNERLRIHHHSDQIEAAPMIAAAATGGDVVVADVIPKHLESTTAKLLEMGMR